MSVYKPDGKQVALSGLVVGQDASCAAASETAAVDGRSITRAKQRSTVMYKGGMDMYSVPKFLITRVEGR